MAGSRCALGVNRAAVLLPAHETEATGRRRKRLRVCGSSISVCSSRRGAAVRHRAAESTALLSQMTLEEKLGQLQQLDGHADGRFRDEHLELARKGLLGSTLNVRGAAQVNALQRAAVEGSRLKIPLIFAFDVIHGYRTVFPIPLGEAASWDPAAAERSASIAAAETRAAGVHWTFAPMVDIARDARWGRIAEGAGEDPYLGAAMAHGAGARLPGRRLQPPRQGGRLREALGGIWRRRSRSRLQQRRHVGTHPARRFTSLRSRPRSTPVSARS